MKDNNIRKAALIIIFLLCFPLAAFAAENTNADDDSYLARNGVSVLMSGARMAGGSKAIKATWSIKVYDVNLETGKYSFLNEYFFPMKIRPLQPYAERTYRVVNGERDLFESVVLAYTPLNTYVFPQWKEKQDQPRFSIALVDANDTPFSQGVPLAANTYVLDTLPYEIFLIISDYQTGEMVSRVALVADSCPLPTRQLDNE